ncbi:Integral membrane protein CcmA involved in cell shape determination [gamma proteobacterium IMCC1989]|nr:Integral membrane protein CcmA involved in cell shape determination [gamma proteobacterium IMCC1989]
MFGKKEKKTAFAAGGTTLISKSTEIVGDVHFSGTLMIEGHIKGNVYAQDADNAQARVLESGKVEGEIRVPSLVINGTVTGNVYSSKHIELASKTVINGNVHYALIEIVKGAQVNGSLVYTTKQDVLKPKKVTPSTPVQSNPSSLANDAVPSKV